MNAQPAFDRRAYPVERWKPEPVVILPVDGLITGNRDIETSSTWVYAHQEAA